MPSSRDFRLDTGPLAGPSGHTGHAPAQSRPRILNPLRLAAATTPACSTRVRWIESIASLGPVRRRRPPVCLVADSRPRVTGTRPRRDDWPDFVFTIGVYRAPSARGGADVRVPKHRHSGRFRLLLHGGGRPARAHNHQRCAGLRGLRPRVGSVWLASDRPERRRRGVEAAC